MDETRFSRLENRVDEIKDDVSELKAGQKILEATVTTLHDDLHEHIKAVNEHVSSDSRIIQQVSPLLTSLPHLTEMVDDHRFKKESRKRTVANVKLVSMKFGAASALVAILVGLARLFGFF